MIGLAGHDDRMLVRTAVVALRTGIVIKSTDQGATSKDDGAKPPTVRIPLGCSTRTHRLKQWAAAN